MKKMNYFFIGLITLAMFAGCQGGGSDSNQGDSSDVMTSDISNIKKAISDVYYMFPSPAEMLTVINQGGIVYEKGLLNSTENREKYVKSNEQYLNLGIYIADLSYCALFARNNDAEDYLETIKRMSDEVGLSIEINKKLIEKLKENVNSIDSLEKVTNEFFFNIVNDLEDNNRQNDVAVITTGAYIECLYLSVNLVKKYSSDNLIIKKIAEQKYAFNNLYQYSKKYISNEEMLNSFSYIIQINDVFGQFREMEEKMEVKKESVNHLIISGGGTTVISESEFKVFKENINKIRKSITK